MNPLSERPDIRRRVYIAFWGLGLTLGGAQTGYAAAQAGQPVWLNVALSVYAFLGAGIGYTGKKPQSLPAGVGTMRNTITLDHGTVTAS